MNDTQAILLVVVVFLLFGGIYFGSNRRYYNYFSNRNGTGLGTGTGLGKKDRLRRYKSRQRFTSPSQKMPEQFAESNEMFASSNLAANQNFIENARRSISPFANTNETPEVSSGLSSLPVSVMPGSSLAPPNHVVNPVTSYNTNILAPPTPSNPAMPESKTSLSDTMTQSEYAPLGCFPKDQLTSADLLPKQGGWEASNPAVPLSSLSGANFLTSGTMYGINTTGSSLRNANLQLRSDPCIPRMNVGPWSQSTIESDNNRKYLEIGNA